MKPYDPRAQFEFIDGFLVITMDDPVVTGQTQAPALVYPPLVIRQGADWSLTVKWVDSTGAAIDLTGRLVRAKIKTAAQGASLVSLTNGSGVALGTITGTVVFTRTAAQTALYTFTRGVMDLEVYTTTGSPAVDATVVSLCEAPVRLDKEITA